MKEGEIKKEKETRGRIYENNSRMKKVRIGSHP
jgi:hypothetical protein